MKIVLINTLAVIAGLFVGSLVNMGLIMVSGKVIPPPAGVDVTNLESLKASIHLFEPRHFLFPFLAHALGTLTGAAIAALVARTHKVIFAMVIGLLFLAGGVANTFMIPAPIWFVILDLAVAYLPMAWFGYRIAGKCC
jgi:hypothetical protein